MDLSHFGAVEHDWHMQLHMPAGLLGFPEVKEYLIVDPAPELPVKWLQAPDELNLAFVITDPGILLPDYQVELSHLDLMTSEPKPPQTSFSLPLSRCPVRPRPIPR
jgi:flagellar assembly factor FliW